MRSAPTSVLKTNPLKKENAQTQNMRPTREDGIESHSKSLRFESSSS